MPRSRKGTLTRKASQKDKAVGAKTRELRFNLPRKRFEIRKSSDGSQATVTGYAAVFDSLSEDLGGFREKIQRGAFAQSLRDAGTVDNDPLCLYGHDMNNVLGRVSSKTLTLEEDSTGLRFSCQLPNTSLGRDVATLIERGDIKAMSFGFAVMPGGDTWEQNSDGSVIRTLTNVQLFECSIVSMPAYSSTSVDLRSCPVNLRSKLTRSGDDDPCEEYEDVEDCPVCDEESDEYDEDECETRSLRRRLRKAEQRIAADEELETLRLRLAIQAASAKIV
jgi:uncharacterized protein